MEMKNVYSLLVVLLAVFIAGAAFAVGANNTLTVTTPTPQNGVYSVSSILTSTDIVDSTNSCSKPLSFYYIQNPSSLGNPSTIDSPGAESYLGVSSKGIAGSTITSTNGVSATMSYTSGSMVSTVKHSSSNSNSVFYAFGPRATLKTGESTGVNPFFYYAGGTDTDTVVFSCIGLPDLVLKKEGAQLSVISSPGNGTKYSFNSDKVKIIYPVGATGADAKCVFTVNKDAQGSVSLWSVQVGGDAVQPKIVSPTAVTTVIQAVLTKPNSVAYFLKLLNKCLVTGDCSGAQEQGVPASCPEEASAGGGKTIDNSVNQST